MALARSQDYVAGNTIEPAEVDAEFTELYAAIGTQVYTEDNYIADDQTVTASLDALDMKVKDVLDGTAKFTGTMMVGDTANANNTAGLTLNQAAADDEILTFKSSDIAHAYTTGSETDTFGKISKSNAAEGGLSLQAFAEDAAVTGVLWFGAYGGTADTTKSNAGNALIEFYAGEHNGSGTAAAVTADGNVFAIKCNQGGSTKTIWMVDEDGDMYYDGSDAGVFDEFEDAAMCRDLSKTLSGRFNEFIRYNKKALHDAKVISVGPGVDGKESIFVSRKRLDMLQLGAVSELYKVVMSLCKKLNISYEDAKLLT